MWRKCRQVAIARPIALILVQAIGWAAAVLPADGQAFLLTPVEP